MSHKRRMNRCLSPEAGRHVARFERRRYLPRKQRLSRCVPKASSVSCAQSVESGAGGDRAARSRAAQRASISTFPESDHNRCEHFKESFNPEVNYPAAPVFSGDEVAALTVHQPCSTATSSGPSGLSFASDGNSYLSLRLEAGPSREVVSRLSSHFQHRDSLGRSEFFFFQDLLVGRYREEVHESRGAD